MENLETLKEEVNEYIVKAVSDAWDKDAKYLLLSQLGSSLKRDLPESEMIMSKGVKDYLRTWPIVQIVDHPEFKEKIGLLPVEISLPDCALDHFPQRSTPKGHTRPPIFQDEFWKAFEQPIDGKRYIFIKSDGSVVSRDLLADGAPNDAYEVLSSDLVSSRNHQGGSLAVQKYGLISAWLERHGLDQEKFLKYNINGIKKSHHDRLALLETAFRDIPSEDLARVSIPLDVLFRLVNQN